MLSLGWSWWLARRLHRFAFAALCGWLNNEDTVLCNAAPLQDCAGTKNTPCCRGCHCPLGRCGHRNIKQLGHCNCGGRVNGWSGGDVKRSRLGSERFLPGIIWWERLHLQLHWCHPRRLPQLLWLLFQPRCVMILMWQLQSFSLQWPLILQQWCSRFGSRQRGGLLPNDISSVVRLLLPQTGGHLSSRLGLEAGVDDVIARVSHL
mmetsp:Transcript_49152/g.114961  ORF Transcript_49152/g.114961 Transcript_49152/m.114961 type:complete len:205 (-) Transcript_49152:279-893(-)